MGGPKGREIGHGMIAEKALRPVVPSQEEFPYMILVTSEILSSNGSSSMASTCGSTLALMDAGVPIKEMIAGVAMGLIVSDEKFTKYEVLTDLSGEEDKGGFLDFKMTGSRNGVTAIQCDMKVQGMPMNVLYEVIKQSQEGRYFILDEMEKTITKPKENVSQYAPKMLRLVINKDKIGMIIGSGGKVIKEIQEQTHSEIFIEEDGTVVISAESEEFAKKAFDIVVGLSKDVEVGEIYDGTVKDLLNFGALVEILPGRVGLLHVSEIANTYVKDVRDWFKPGDQVRVKVVALGDEGKISLSKKALEPEASNRSDRN
jgi:polyribonucleotide nucleotidyltransferase